MLSAKSPFLNIPVALERKQALFLDGMRHSAQIVDLSYTRLCQALTELSVSGTTAAGPAGFTHVFLDAWAFIDAADRFRCLWEMQPGASAIPDPFSADSVRKRLRGVREVRNVSAHLAQKIDQLVSLNSSVLGEIKWVSSVADGPLKVTTHFIRPGIMRGNVKANLAMPRGEVSFNQGSGCISVAVGKSEVNLSLTYEVICSIVEFAEANLNRAFQNSALDQRLPTDMFGKAELDTRGA